MDVPDQFKSIVSLIGDPVRAVMLWSLLDGKAFTATELAINAEVSPQSASMHLKKLVNGKVLTQESQGRHRYYRFSNPEVAYVIEAMANLLPLESVKKGVVENPPAINTIKYCRTCYDHLAGKVGVEVTQQMIKQKILIATGKQYDVTAKGTKWFNSFGIAIDELKRERRVFGRQCLDWSERRHHLAGSLGAAFLDMMLASGWIRRIKGSRAIVVTEKGQNGLYDTLNLIL